MRHRSWCAGGEVRPVALVVLLAGFAGLAAGCASSGEKKAAEDASASILRLGYVQMERGQVQEAMASAQDALKRDPKNPEAHNFLGLIHMSQSDYAKAIVELKEAVRLNPFFTDAHNNLGVAYRETKEYDKALAEFETALKDRTYRTPEKVQLNLGQLYEDQGVLASAVQAYERAVATNPKYGRGYLALGLAYQKMGRRDEAIAQFRKVVDLAPDTPEAQRARQQISRPARSGS